MACMGLFLPLNKIYLTLPHDHGGGDLTLSLSYSFFKIANFCHRTGDGSPSCPYSNRAYQAIRPRRVSTTRPSNHSFLGSVYSITKTRSFGRTLHSRPDHLVRARSVGKYSRVHLVQKRSAKYWTCRQRRLPLRSLS